MKAKFENNSIKIYYKIPSVYHGKTGSYPGGFHLQTDDIHRQEGFFPLITPDYSPADYSLGAPYFDEINQVFTYELVTCTYDLEKIRAQKLEEFNNIIEKEMTSALNIGVIEKLAMGEEIPPELKDKINILRIREAEVKQAINSIQDEKVLSRFSFDRNEIEDHKQSLKSVRRL